MSHLQIDALLAESADGFDVHEQDGLREELGSLLSYVEDAAPAPSPELAALLGLGPEEAGATVVPLRRPERADDRHDRRLTGPRGAVTGAVVLAMATVGATGLSAAANSLPAPLQRHVADLSRTYLPFDFPQPRGALDRDRAEGLPAPDDGPVGDGVAADSRADLDADRRVRAGDDGESSPGEEVRSDATVSRSAARSGWATWSGRGSAGDAGTSPTTPTSPTSSAGGSGSAGPTTAGSGSQPGPRRDDATRDGRDDAAGSTSGGGSSAGPRAQQGTPPPVRLSAPRPGRPAPLSPPAAPAPSAGEDGDRGDRGDRGGRGQTKDLTPATGQTPTKKPVDDRGGTQNPGKSQNPGKTQGPGKDRSKPAGASEGRTDVPDTVGTVIDAVGDLASGSDGEG